MHTMDVKNNLAKALRDSLFTAQNYFSLADDCSLLNSQQCGEKISQYMAWIKQLKINSVLLISPPSIDALCLCYALVLSNKTYIPVHTSTSSALLNTYLQTYQIDLLVAPPQLANQFDSELKNKLMNENNNVFLYYLPPKLQPTFCLLPGIILFTSGTSEQPKAVYYHYDTLQRYLLWCKTEFKLQQNDHFLFTTELAFVASLRPLFVPALAGASLRFIGSGSTNKLRLIINALLKTKITILNTTPTLFKILMRHLEKNAQQHALSSIRCILLSGEPIDTSVINYWFSHLKADSVFYNLYGATEYLVPFYKKISTALPEDERLHLGQLRAGCDYKLVPKATNTYELYITGDISTAYFDEKLTQSNYLLINNQRFIKTNDAVNIRHHELFYCSRAQRIIKKYGQLVNLDQIEQVLKKEQPTVDFITVVDEENENKIYLLIGGTLQDATLLKKIKLSLAAHLPNYMHPDEYRFTPEVPLTASGKIDYLLIKKTVIAQQLNELTDYFRRFFPEQMVNLDTRIIDLGLESIDYIEMAEAFLKITGKWLDVAQINAGVRIANIASCLSDVAVEKSITHAAVALNAMQAAFYTQELSKQEDVWTCIIAMFCLKGPIDVTKLETAIAETLANHFMLTYKLTWQENGYFFVHAPIQAELQLPTPIFFPKKLLIQLKTSVHADRLARIYIQKRKNQYFLIMAYHHIIMDGWSAILVREEIFRRYEGIQVTNVVSKADEINYLNQANQIWPHAHEPLNELKSRLSHVNPKEYNQLDAFFAGPLQKHNTYLSFAKTKVDQFARAHQLQAFPYSVLFALLLHQLIALQSGVNKLFFYTSFSNRNLPIPQIKELITNLATGLPIFFDNTQRTPQKFALQIKENFRAYFKNMSYGGLADIWQHEIISRKILSLREQPYFIFYTYINKIVDQQYIQNKYIDWQQSKNELNARNKGVVFLRVYNMGSQFVVILDSHLKKNGHEDLLSCLHELLK